MTGSYVLRVGEGGGRNFRLHQHVNVLMSIGITIVSKKREPDGLLLRQTHVFLLNYYSIFVSNELQIPKNLNLYK